jgi:uncharacterized iron-regulated protein
LPIRTQAVHRTGRPRPYFFSRAALLLGALVVAPAAPVALTGWSPILQSGYVPERVFDTARGAFVDFEVMLFDLARGDVVFVGEQHDDRNTHRLELAVLEGLRRRRDGVILSLEMFERDVQEPLDRFAMGHSTEDEFLAAARPWPRYRTDYKPLVDFAVAHQWRVVAANVPRPIASEVSKGGFGVLDSKSDEERRWFAAERICPIDDEYYRRFVEAMGEHTAGGAGDPATAEVRTHNYYYAQCLKDETMAESIAAAYASGAAGGPQPVVVHFNGAFHSDFGLGTAARVRRRLPDRRTVIVSIVAVEDIDAVAPDADARRQADYLVFTTR